MITRGAKEAIDLGKGGSYSLSRDVLKYHLYDSLIIGTTAVDRTFFSVQQGQTYGTGQKTINETNMLDSSKLPNGQTFLINKLSIALISNFAAASTDPELITQAWVNYLQHSVLEISIAGRDPDFQIPGSELLPRLTVNGQTGAANIAVRQGDMINSGIASLGVTPIFIGELITFSVRMRTGSPVANVQTILDANATLLNGDEAEMRCTLEGVLTRAK